MKCEFKKEYKPNTICNRKIMHISKCILVMVYNVYAMGTWMPVLTHSKYHLQFPLYKKSFDIIKFYKNATNKYYNTIFKLYSTDATQKRPLLDF